MNTTRQKKELCKRIEEIREWIEMDMALGGGFVPESAYGKLYDEIHRLEEQLAHLSHYESAEEMYFDDIESRAHSQCAAEKGVDRIRERYLTREQVERIRRQYPVGARVKLHRMDDPNAVPSGMIGTVAYVDDAGQIGMQWDNGRSLALVPGVDLFSRIDMPKRAKGGDAR